MSIADTVREARVLNEHGHKEGALRSLLIAVAATSKKRYPHQRYPDKVAFTAFVRDEMIAGNFFGPHCCIAVSMLWKGYETPLEDILYDLRCSLVHEAKMHDFVKYDPLQDPATFILRINHKGALVFQDSLLDNLLKCIHNVSENALDLPQMPFITRKAAFLKTAKPEYRLTVSTSLSLPLS